ncbi:DeoR/GlpR family DNA-binding transcription regulator [Chitinophaga japonensis]|uniref:DeoR family transcriptional regulator n=1 Tax=Chitinophaga japonensis TaxID=104662 RepID=A0A562T021_CHIJA|nr:DeoR/GlpR family DNA-binding transcription regulator [Chitinophaga japonensis]TWI86895.1 DeoR family transcriptional regulator [Chitinophaga japonensis]
MGFPERKKRILNALESADSLDVRQLSAQLDISPVTIRRDLQLLADEGLLIRTHGGAMKAASRHPFTAFLDKATVMPDKKRQIGKLAASLVQEGDTIFLDCGSTVFCMCEHLKRIPGLRIITNSLPVVAEFMEVDQVQVNLIGGEIDKARKAVHGQQAVLHIDSYHAAKAFIGVDGLSANRGLTAFSEKEAAISKAMSRNADLVYLLCDSSKIGKDSYFKFAPLSVFNFLITDKEIPAQQVKALKAKHVEIMP